jgi:hypothetical protein
VCLMDDVISNVLELEGAMSVKADYQVDDCKQ